MLEERLVEYDGTLIVVSHDRAFLNNVVTSLVVFEPGGIREVVGGYDDWVRQRKAQLAEESSKQVPKSGGKSSSGGAKEADVAGSASAAAPTGGGAKPKLSYKEKQELDRLPALIDEIEAKQAALHVQMAEPDYFKSAASDLASDAKKMEKLDADLVKAYSRLEELEGRV